MKLSHFLPALVVLFASVSAVAADPAFDTWVDTFTADWIRVDPNAATEAQYFSGAEQDQLDRQITPVTKGFRASRVAAANKGLAELARFDRTRLDGSQKVSADLVRWSLDDVVKGDEFSDFELTSY